MSACSTPPENLLADTGPDAAADVLAAIDAAEASDVSDVGADATTEVNDLWTDPVDAAATDAQVDSSPDSAEAGDAGAMPMDAAAEVDSTPPTDTAPLLDTSPIDVGAEDAAGDEELPVDDAVVATGIPCKGGDPCFTEWYCQTKGCGDGLEGVCAPMAKNCAGEEITGACGCDGNSYLSACHASNAGTNVLGGGACPENTTLDCNVSDGSSCPDGEFCWGGCEGVGSCISAQDNCPQGETQWSCGCNGVNYSSPCMAHKFKVNIDHDGFCEGSNNPPAMCAGPDELLCPADEHCNVLTCDADATGSCTGIFDPIANVPGIICLPGEAQECGCDGVTYLNKCQRIKADVAKAKSGPCEGKQTCNVENGNTDCATGLVCVAPAGVCNGAGTCEPADFLCCLVNATKVCGCDGNTYGCMCSANKAGVPVLTVGPCGSL